MFGRTSLIVAIVLTAVVTLALVEALRPALDLDNFPIAVGRALSRHIVTGFL